jgi:hypothetical protein
VLRRFLNDHVLYRRTGIILFLILAMPFMFAAGLAHEIVHFGWENRVVADMVASKKRDDEKSPHAHHSCLAYSALTLAAIISCTILVIPVLSGASIQLAGIAFLSACTRFIPSYRSRAPPLHRCRSTSLCATTICR